jgi:DNA-binding NarL/FixJ family response regulator
VSTAAVRHGTPLTPREAEVLSAASNGATDAEIAARLFISPATVKTHLQHAYTRLGASGSNARANAVYLALKAGVIR